MNDHVLQIVVSRGLQSGNDQELLCAVDGFEDISQFGSESLRQRESYGIDCIERQTQIWKEFNYIVRLKFGSAYQKSVSHSPRHPQSLLTIDAIHMDSVC